MPWTHCTGEKGCGGWYQTDYRNECQTDGWTPEELEEFRWSPEWEEHERKSHEQSKRGKFKDEHEEVSCWF